MTTYHKVILSQNRGKYNWYICRDWYCAYYGYHENAGLIIYTQKYDIYNNVIIQEFGYMSAYYSDSIIYEKSNQEFKLEFL